MGRPALSLVEEEQARDDILNVARKLFLSKGFEAVTVRAIADGVGCSPMRLYRYFPNKRGILRRLWDDIFIEQFQELTPKVDRCDGAEDKLRCFMREYVGYWLANPREYCVIFMNQDAVSDETELYYVDESDTLTRTGYLRAIIEDGVRKEVFRRLDAELATQHVMCLLHGIAHMLITVPEYPWMDSDRIVEESIDTTLRGLLVKVEN